MYRTRWPAIAAAAGRRYGQANVPSGTPGIICPKRRERSLYYIRRSRRSYSIGGSGWPGALTLAEGRTQAAEPRSRRPCDSGLVWASSPM